MYLGTEAGESCNRRGCKGVIVREDDGRDGCTCHLGHPPCSYCVDSNYICPKCGWDRSVHGEEGLVKTFNWANLHPNSCITFDSYNRVHIKGYAKTDQNLILQVDVKPVEDYQSYTQQFLLTKHLTDVCVFHEYSAENRSLSMIVPVSSAANLPTWSLSKLLCRFSVFSYDFDSYKKGSFSTAKIEFIDFKINGVSILDQEQLKNGYGFEVFNSSCEVRG